VEIFLPDGGKHYENISRKPDGKWVFENDRLYLNGNAEDRIALLEAELALAKFVLEMNK
jgi:hypothetical protein